MGDHRSASQTIDYIRLIRDRHLLDDGDMQPQNITKNLPFYWIPREMHAETHEERIKRLNTILQSKVSMFLTQKKKDLEQEEIEEKRKQEEMLAKIQRMKRFRNRSTEEDGKSPRINSFKLRQSQFKLPMKEQLVRVIDNIKRHKTEL